jgi:deferrochelatase/peroxidase EfeB
MTIRLDLADIQGNVLTAYGKLGFPRGRVILLNIADMAAGRDFVTDILPLVTTALRWPSARRPIPPGQIAAERPDVAVNIGFTWYGLLALGIPTRTLRAMPDEFIDGMARRASMLGDNFGQTNPMSDDFLASWDLVWRRSLEIGPSPTRVHVMITLNAQMPPEAGADPLENVTAQILAHVDGAKLQLLTGHDPHDASVKFQELTALFDPASGLPCPKEHFGFTDAIGDPVFDGQYGTGEAREAIGNGAVDGEGRWRPLATGEFLLGYPDEAQEIAGMAMPLDFSRNGTFVAYRKLHQNVASFRDFLTKTALQFGAVFGIANQADAYDLLMAKIAGRWSDGVPLSRAPTVADWIRFNATYPMADPATQPAAYALREEAVRNFTFADDVSGSKCPVTAHMRRVNTRDMLDPTAGSPAKERGGSVLNNRRRILRRGLPYGRSPADTTDADAHGIVMLATCASLFRQFEFMQQQWLNYGLDSGAGNDTCPLVGNHAQIGPKAKFVIAADPKAGHPPFIVEGLPQFVETRGGDYFFVPSMTALRMIGMGVVDPT